MSLITYLFIGIVWDIIYNFISTIIESSNKLNNWERVISLVLWPIVIIIFGYHFIKTFIGK